MNIKNISPPKLHVLKKKEKKGSQRVIYILFSDFGAPPLDFSPPFSTAHILAGHHMNFWWTNVLVHHVAVPQDDGIIFH